MHKYKIHSKSSTSTWSYDIILPLEDPHFGNIGIYLYRKIDVSFWNNSNIINYYINILYTMHCIFMFTHKLQFTKNCTKLLYGIVSNLRVAVTGTFSYFFFVFFQKTTHVILPDSSTPSLRALLLYIIFEEKKQILNSI